MRAEAVHVVELPVGDDREGAGGGRGFGSGRREEQALNEPKEPLALITRHLLQSELGNE